MFKLFQRINDSFKTTDGKKSRSVSGGLTRSALADLIFDEFKQKMAEETSEFQLLFPASFTIYLSPSDFEQRKSGFPFTVKELVNRFNREIRKQMAAGHSDYIAHSKYWFFKFNCFPEEASLFLDGREITSLPPGEVLIQSDLVPEGEDSVSKSPAGGRVVKTVVDNNPVIPTGAINNKAVMGVTAKPGYTYIVGFENFEDLTNETFSEESAKPKAPEKPASFGRLSVRLGPPFLVDGRRVTDFEVTVPELYISGIHDATSIGGIHVLHLATDEVVSTHVLLTALAPGHFQVKAKGLVWASGVQLDASSEGTAEVRSGGQLILGDGLVVIDIK